MGVVDGIGRDDGAAQTLPRFQRPKALVIELPNPHAPGLDLSQSGELGAKQGSQGLGRDIGGTCVLPGVSVPLPPQEGGAVGALFPQNFRPAAQGGIPDTEAAPLPHDDILGLMEGEAACV